MIRSKTTFVIGAGASKDAGFPLGSELKDIIQEKLDIRFSRSTQVAGDRRLGRYIMDVANQDHPKAQAMQDAALMVVRKLPQVASIDTLLSLLENPDAVALAKMAIVSTISNAERSSPLFTEGLRTEASWFKSSSRTWYAELFKTLHEDVPRSRLDGIFENIQIITFNYDRTLEQFLFRALQNLYDISVAEAGKILNRLDVIHPYGSIGPLPWADKSGVEFGKTPDLELAPDRILTFSEQINDRYISARIDGAISEAQKIIFLGFGYLEANLAALSPSKPIEATDISGTALGLSANDVGAVERSLSDWLAEFASGGLPLTNSRVALDNKSNCLEYFLNYGRFIRS